MSTAWMSRSSVFLLVEAALTPLIQLQPSFWWTSPIAPKLNPGTWWTLRLLLNLRIKQTSLSNSSTVSILHVSLSRVPSLSALISLMRNYSRDFNIGQHDATAASFLTVDPSDDQKGPLSVVVTSHHREPLFFRRFQASTLQCHVFRGPLTVRYL